jgi:uncharacterized protein (TIGR00730 family)
MGVSGLTVTGKNVVSIFGSSRPGPRDPDYRLAFEVGRGVAESGLVVCNGGYGGVMEASARGAQEAQAPGAPQPPRTIGVIAKEAGGRSANRWIESVMIVDTMVDRLLKLIALGDAYVVLKGGTGTLLELAAVWEFMNKGSLQQKPIIVVGPFWNSVVTTLREELELEGLAKSATYVTIVNSSNECTEFVRSWKSGG